MNAGWRPCREMVRDFPAGDRRIAPQLAVEAGDSARRRVLLVAVVLIRTAWICDDAYITFRTIDNFLHGFGLRWNVAERVQSFTHPLWLIVRPVLLRAIEGLLCAA